MLLAMKQRYAGEARHAILSKIASSQRPKMVVVVDPCYRRKYGTFFKTESRQSFSRSVPPLS
jgi:hypothetical protein